mgnify:FL=1
MIIGIDVDEVLAEMLEAFLEFHNQNYKTALQKKDMFSYSFHEVIGGTDEETRKKLIAFFDTDLFQNIRPVQGSLEAISRLAKEHKLCIITARPNILRVQTERWLQQYFPDCFQSIDLTNQWHGEGSRKLKSEVGKKNKIDMMIDDSLHHAQDCASQGIYTLLADFQYPCNRLPRRGL